MADIQHSNLTDSDGIHEPKDISGSSVGQVYVADGAGSGNWESNTISNHGGMEIINNSTATAVTAAVDATLNTDTDYVKITAGWSAGLAIGIGFNVDELVAPVSGHYRISFWSSIKVPLNNNFIGIKFAIDDSAPYSLQKLVSQSVTTNDYKNMFGSGIIDLTAGQTVSIYVASTKTDNLVVEEGGLQMFLVHE